MGLPPSLPLHASLAALAHALQLQRQGPGSRAGGVQVGSRATLARRQPAAHAKPVTSRALWHAPLCLHSVCCTNYAKRKAPSWRLQTGPTHAARAPEHARRAQQARSCFPRGKGVQRNAWRPAPRSGNPHAAPHPARSSPHIMSAMRCGRRYIQLTSTREAQAHIRRWCVCCAGAPTPGSCPLSMGKLAATQEARPLPQATRQPCPHECLPTGRPRVT